MTSHKTSRFNHRLALSLISVLISVLLMGMGCLEAKRNFKTTQDESTRINSGSEDELSQDFDRPSLDYPETQLGASALRRLTRTQYQQALQDIFGPTLVVPPIAEPDDAQGGLLSIGASLTTLSARGVSSLEESAFAIAQQVLEEPALRAQTMTCELIEGQQSESTEEGTSCARSLFIELGARLWRRPLIEAELDRLVQVYELAQTTLGDPEKGFSFALAALIQSPHFMYRVELPSLQELKPTPSQEINNHRLDAYALATRLSFFLWNTTPDVELLEAARNGELLNTSGLRAQSERLLASPRLYDGITQLFSEQLRLYELDRIQKDPQNFEHFKPELLRDARRETLELLLYITLEAEGDFRDVMTTRQSFITPRLAALYQIPAPTLEGLKRVELPPESNRIGLLSHASILTLNAHPTTSSATLRGAFVRKTLLCQTIPLPPPGVDTAIPEPSGMTRTLRERVAEHLDNPTCAGCHELLDPIGLGLENYDALGQWRTLDHGAEIDPSGELDGVAFAHPSALAQAIRDHPAFTPCFVRTLARYAIGRIETSSEEPLLTELSSRFERAQYRLKPLLLDLILSPLFRDVGAPQ